MRHKDRSISSSSSYSKSSVSKKSNRSLIKPEESKEIKEVTKCFLFVENLTANVNELHLKEIFSIYGNIADIHRYNFNKNNARYKISALINYNKIEDAENAHKCMNGGQIDGTKIKVEVFNLTDKQVERYLNTNRIETIEEYDKKKTNDKKRSPVRKRYKSRSRSRNYKRKNDSSSSDSSSNSSSSSGSSSDN